jgi:hypothetical protein
MYRIAIVIWIILGASLAGVGLAIVVAVPALADQGMKLIPWAVLAGFVVAIPASFLVASKMSGPSGLLR